MYQNIHVDRKTETIFVWDDEKGQLEYPMSSFRYAYRRSAGGKFKSIYGDVLEKILNFNENDPDLFESDVPMETRVLIDLYGESDDTSKNHRVAFIDIEVDSTGGFPNIEEADKEITAIALYDQLGNQYHVLVLDPDERISHEKLTIIPKNGAPLKVRGFDNETSLLSSFLNLWEEVAPTIVTGWNCIPLTQSVWLKNKIVPIGKIQETNLFDSKLIKKYPISVKEKWCITLSNGQKVYSSGDHKFPVKLINPDEYTDFRDTRKNNSIDCNIKTRQISSFYKKVDVYCQVPLRKNDNSDNKKYTCNQLYLAGLIYTDGSLKSKNSVDSGYTFYQSDLSFINILNEYGVDSSVVGPYKNCYSRNISRSLIGDAHHLIYDELNKKTLNLEEISTLSRIQFISFLSGLLDGDECARKSGFGWCNYNGDIDKMSELCQWNGIFTTRSSKNLLWFVNLNPSELRTRKEKRWKKCCPANLKRDSKQKSGQIKFKKVEDVYWVKVKNVEYVGTSTRMVDIETDTHFFVTSGIKTHNCNGFDLPYLYTRLKRELGYKGAKRLSPIGISYISKWNNTMVIAGVSCLDYMDMVKLFPSKKEPNYTLGYIGKKFVGLDKIHYKGNLNDLYRTDLTQFIEYNFNDVQIVVELDKKLNYIDIARSLCHAGHVPYEYFDTSSKYIEGAILMYLRRGSKEIVKNKSATGREEYQQQMDEGEEGFSGAYVKKPVPGKYHYVFDLDLTSMYPSIIISLNISPETKVGIISRVVYDDDFLDCIRKQIDLNYYESDSDEEIDRDSYMEREIHKFNIDAHFRKHIKEYVIGETVYTKEEFFKLIQDSKYSLSSNGCLYRTDKVGVIPSILIDWFNLRKEYRKKAKEAFTRGDMVEYAYFDQRQYTIKILLNSVYGVLGLPVFRFYDRDNAEAVTTTGVTIIKTAAAAINEYYKMVLGEEKDYVVYTDTDSCFVSAIPIIEKNYPNVDRKDPKAMSEATLEITGEVQIFVNKFFDLMAKHFFNLDKHRFDAKQELISKTSFWLAKKRYAQLVINKEGKMLDHPELEVKGIDVVRTSFPAKFRTFMEQFLIDLLTGEKTQNQIDSDIINFKKGMKELKVEDLAKNTSVKFVSRDGKTNYNPKSRKPFHFEPKTPAQVKSALAYNDMIHHFGLDKTSEPIYHGQKIKYIYLKTNRFGIESMAMKADGTDPDEILEFVEQYVDRTAMYEKELKSKLTDFYRVLHWEYPTESKMVANQFFDF